MAGYPFKRFFAFLFGTILLFAGSAYADHLALPFMTVDEYVDIHPEQKPLMDAFNARVSGKGEKLPQLPKKPAKIAFVYPGHQTSDYWRRSVSSFMRRMDEIGIPYAITEYFSKPSEEDKLQEAQVRTALKSDPDYLVFTLDVFKHKQLVQDILSQERPKLILQNITTPLREWEDDEHKPFMYIGFDHAIGAKLLADYYIKATGGTGAYGLLYYTKGYVSTMRGDSFRGYIATYSHLELADQSFTDGKLDKAEQATLKMVKSPGVKFLYACSTDVALGAIKGLKQSGNLGKIMINGWGGGSSELDAIMAGDMDVTVMRMNDDNGVAMAEGIRLDIQGKGDQVPAIYSGDMVLVEKGISRKDLNELIQRAFRYSGR